MYFYSTQSRYIILEIHYNTENNNLYFFILKYGMMKMFNYIQYIKYILYFNYSSYV